VQGFTAPMHQQLASRLKGASAEHWLGTDNFWRDVLSRVIWGERVTLFVGIISVALGALVGVAVGINAGHFGKRIVISSMPHAAGPPAYVRLRACSDAADAARGTSAGSTGHASDVTRLCA
jgi:hypothetical protein